MDGLKSYLPRVYRFRIYEWQRPTEISPVVSGVVVRQATVETVQDIAWWSSGRAQDAIKMLKQGQLVFYAYCDGKAVGVSCVWIRKLKFLNKIPWRLVCQSATAVSGNSAVHPQYRGHKIFQLLLKEKIRYVREIGIQHIYDDVLYTNIASRKGIEHVGFVHIANRWRVQIRSHILFNIYAKKDSKWFI